MKLHSLCFADRLLQLPHEHKTCSNFINMRLRMKCCFSPVWSLQLALFDQEQGEESERGKMSLPVVNWAYRFLMCQAVALQMRDGTFLRCIFLCFLFKANEVSLPVATWAGRSDTRDAFTSPFTKSSSESSSSTPPPPTPPPILSQPEGKHGHIESRFCARAHTAYENARARTQRSGY